MDNDVVHRHEKRASRGICMASRWQNEGILTGALSGSVAPFRLYILSVYPRENMLLSTEYLSACRPRRLVHTHVLKVSESVSAKRYI